MSINLEEFYKVCDQIGETATMLAKEPHNDLYAELMNYLIDRREAILNEQQ